MTTEAQSFSVKRAEVEFHTFAALGEPERAIAAYEEENRRRSAILRAHADFIGGMSPFLEIGSNIGHTSYMLANEFGAQGFALDISADSLRLGTVLQDRWGLNRAPIRVVGDAEHLPFADESIRFVMAFQVLSQFMDIEHLFVEIKRVLAPGGVFLFAEEPLKRLLTLRLYRAPYYPAMKPWERKLYDWGLLGFVVRDVIGAGQEESFGIRQNHTMGLKEWHALTKKHFADCRYQVFVRDRGWGEKWVKRMATRLDPYGSEWRAARLLGGTLAAVCKKTGTAPDSHYDETHFESRLRCPDCGMALGRDASDTLRCGSCGYSASNEGGVFNLLPSAERKELYPGDRADVIDFSVPGHESKLLGHWDELEGEFGNKYRWIQEKVAARLVRVLNGPQRLRIRGHAHEGHPVTLGVTVNGARLGEWRINRHGLFVIEADVPDAPEYVVEINAGPTWMIESDDREFTVMLGMLRLIPRE